ncbi:ARM repeat-containing protein [Mycena pura]|uniref:ARM repeat-containing protein n=1 Tax=Mycena pura TaxID=153505 RepID=A0AAD6Y2Q4_9AGAR|nr:ARM repeat-containing protein [Mycena pura]
MVGACDCSGQHPRHSFHYDHSPPRRAPQISAPTLKASIRAPQPQPSDVTWPPATREDIFGPSNNLGVGGDARVSSKSGSGNWSASPDLRADTHVEQLLRTLNLNSPEPSPTAGSSPKSTGSAGSGSGASVSLSSALLTPLDSPHGLHSQSPLHGFHSQSPLHGFHSSGHGPAHAHSPALAASESRAHTLASFPSRPRHLAPPRILWATTRASSVALVPRSLWRRGRARAVLSHHWRGRGDGTQDGCRSWCTCLTSLQPINFLSLLHPSSSPPYPTFVARIIKSADQQASIFLQQKLKVAGPEERARIVDAICAWGAEMMHRFGNWAVQRCLEAATGPEERRKIVGCMRGRIVDLATNCYGCHVLQKALDCEEEVRLLIVSELLMGDPAQTLVNKHASHIMELSWTPPAPPIFAYVNKSLKGKWAALACHETGSLVVQHALENLEEIAKDGIVDELLVLEHGSEKHHQMTLDHLLDGLLEFATNEQGSKSVVKALKEGGKETLDAGPPKGVRCATVVDLSLSLTGSQLIATDKDQRAMLATHRTSCSSRSSIVWLFCQEKCFLKLFLLQKCPLLAQYHLT